jgi:hypothetical protein
MSNKEIPGHHPVEQPKDVLKYFLSRRPARNKGIDTIGESLSEN